MIRSRKLPSIAAIFFVTTSAVHSARAAQPPADLCSLLLAAEVSKTLGGIYDSPQKSVAPRPFPNTATVTDCNYLAKGSKLWCRAYVDPSPSGAGDLFAKLSKFYGKQTPITGLGDESYLTKRMDSMSARAKFVSISILNRWISKPPKILFSTLLTNS
jgi:hypothetical protein